MGFEQLYYRGALNFCNYRCSYCIFSTQPASAEVLAQDREQLQRFVGWVAGHPGTQRIFLLPYGEGMVHRHYWDALAALTALPSLQKVGVQTNLSFDVNQFSHHLHQQGGDPRKLVLWCSFHPQQTTLERFLQQLSRLEQQQIAYTVGAVAHWQHREVLLALRQALPPKQYLWFNSMDGMRQEYSQHQKNFFTWLDPFFVQELQPVPAEYPSCVGGKESALVQGNGLLRACPDAGRPMGNLYTGKRTAERCRSRHCRCYLSYSRRRLPLLERFEDRMFRRLDRWPGRLIFFDIDGTLTRQRGAISPHLQQQLERLVAQGDRLFFATALSRPLAHKACGGLWHLFSGGIFLSGAQVVAFDSGAVWEFPLPQQAVQHLQLDAAALLSSTHNDKRMILPLSRCPNNLQDQLTAVSEGGRAVITWQYATKLGGIQMLQRYYGVADTRVLYFDNHPQPGQGIPVCRVQGPEQLSQALRRWCP